MKPAKRDMDPGASSHAGEYGDFEIKWLSGWYVTVRGVPHGPFHTSQAAFGAAKDAIDGLIKAETRG